MIWDTGGVAGVSLLATMRIALNQNYECQKYLVMLAGDNSPR